MPPFEDDDIDDPFVSGGPESDAGGQLSADTVELGPPPSTCDSASMNTLPEEIVDPQGPFRRFRIIRELGRGGCGIVYLAYDRTVKRNVALKIPQVSAVLSSVQRKRFLREAHLGGKFDHPNIVPVYEAGTLGGTYYLATAYCNGPTLRAWLRGRTRGIPVRLAAELTRIVALAIQHAHALGVLHRDIKPSNILLDKPADAASLPEVFKQHEFQYVPRVSDFGLACLISDDNRVTGQGVPLGTAAYMPPEVVDGHTPPSAAGDVYGLGALLYELLTGRPPYDGPNVAETLAAVKTGDLALPRKLRHELPADIEAVCLQCLHADPSRRYASPQALADDLQRFLAGEPTLARPASSLELGLRWMRRNRTAVWVFAAVLGVVLAVSLGLFIHSRQLGELAADIESEKQKAEELLRQSQDSRWQLQRQLYVENVRLGHDAWRNFDVREFDTRLDAALPGPGDPDLRGFEWYYLRRLSEASRTELVHDSGPLYHVRYSRDGTRLACAGASGYVHVLDAADGRILTSFPHSQTTVEGEHSEVNGVGFSPDGVQLATAGDDGVVRIWDWQHRDVLREIPSAGGKVYQAVFHPTQPLLAIGGEGAGARLVNSDTGELVRALDGHSLAIEALEFSPDGSLLATASSDRTTRVWRVEDGSLVTVIAPDAGRLSALSFAPQGDRLAIGSIGGSVIVWNIAADRREFQAQHLDEVQGVSFSKDGERLAACDRGGSIRLWDPDKPADEATIAMWTAHEKRAYAVQFAPDGEALVSVGEDCKLNSWVPGTPATRRLLDVEPQCPPVEDFVLIEASGTLITAHADHLRMWNAVTGEFLQPIPAEESGWSAVAVSRDGSLLAAQHGGQGVCCWTLPSLQQTGAFATVATPTVSELHLSDDARLLAVLNRTAETELTLFATATGERLEFSATNCDAVDWMRGEAILLDGHDDAIHVWNPEHAQPAACWEGHESTVNAFAISPSGDRVASASSDRTVRVWDRKGGTSRRLSGHRSDVTATAFSHDGRTIISGSENGRLIFWNDGTGQLALELGPFAAGVQRIAVTASDEQLLILLSDGQLLILDAPRGR